MQNGGLRTRGIIKTSTPEHPLITVVTVVFNGEATLEQTIQSVVNQTYDNVEYIVVDGNSTDKTLEIIKKYEDEIDYWQSEPDKGIYDAMNKGIGLANGEWMIFIGADDLLFSPFVLKAFVKNVGNFDSNYYGDAFFSYHRYIHDYKFSKLRLCMENICHQAIFYCKKDYKKNFFNLKYKIYADWAYNITLWNKNNFAYIPIMVSIFNESGSSKSGDKIFKNDKKNLIKENFGNLIWILSVIYKPFFRIFHFVKHIFDSKKYPSISC